MKNGEVLQLYETLCRISDNKELTFGVRVGYTMVKNKAKLKDEAQLIHNMRHKIIVEAGIKNDNDELIIPKSKIDETNRKINELMEMDSSIEVEKIDINSLKLNLNIEDIEGLLPMLYEKTPE